MTIRVGIISCLDSLREADDGEGEWWTDWYIWRIVAICDMHEYGRVFATFVTFDDFARVA